MIRRARTKHQRRRAWAVAQITREIGRLGGMFPEEPWAAVAGVLRMLLERPGIAPELLRLTGTPEQRRERLQVIHGDGRAVAPVPQDGRPAGRPYGAATDEDGPPPALPPAA
jgi:hypothetical protein